MSDSMFLPPIPLFSRVEARGFGGIAMSADGSLVAMVDQRQHGVYIHTLTACVADAGVFCTAEEPPLNPQSLLQR
jgi:hypothetical protein